ncbi:MAG: hypothetical protein ACLGHN_00245 [Bacteriovoracia bacterium]
MKNWLLSIKAAVLCAAIVLTPSCGQQGSEMPEINGVKGPHFNVVDGQVLMTFKLLNMQVDAGLKVPIPKTKHSFLEFSPNMIDGGMMLQVYMDVEDLKSISIGVGDGNYLPDGRPVPGIPGGKLENSLRIDTEWHDISFYYHKQLFGLWIPVGFETAGISGYWNINIKDKRVGFLGLVGNDPVRDYKAGAVVLLHLDALKDKQLNRLIELSKRNPHLIY